MRSSGARDGVASGCPPASRSRARAGRRAGDRQDDAVGGGDRRRPRCRRARARRPPERRRGPAVVRRADRPLRGVSAGRAAGAAAEALEVALLRRSPVGVPPQPHAIGLGLRNALAACAPVLVAIDDIQWLDAPSAEALAFAARRLDGADVGFLFARRPGEPVGGRARPGAALAGAAAGRAIEPGAIRELLGGTPAELARRIAEATLGNPLFALEVARALPGRRAPSSRSRPRSRICSARASRRWRAAAPRSCSRSRSAATCTWTSWRRSPRAAPRDRRRARRRRAARRRRPRARLAPAARRRGAHRRAPGRAPRAATPRSPTPSREPEQRALHFALATPRPDAELAARLSTAAARAAARGARPEAVALAEQALRLTPRPVRSSARRRRRARRPSPRAAAAAASPRAAAPLTLAAAAALAAPRPAALSLRRPPPLSGSPRGAAVALARRPARATASRLGYLDVAGERQRLADLLLPEVEGCRPGRCACGRGCCSPTPASTRARTTARASTGRSPRRATIRRCARACSRSARCAPRRRGSSGFATPRRGRCEALPELDAIRALGWARALRGRDLGEVCARFARAARAGAQLVDAPEPLAALQRSWRGEIARRARGSTRASSRSPPSAGRTSRTRGCG